MTEFIKWGIMHDRMAISTIMMVMLVAVGCTAIAALRWLFIWHTAIFVLVWAVLIVFVLISLWNNYAKEMNKPPVVKKEPVVDVPHQETSKWFRNQSSERIN